MIGIIYLFFAIILLTIGHFLKSKRWKNFVDIYEKTDEQNLNRSLAIGYILNFIFPFRLGDAFRVIYSGKKMKNGMTFSLATVLLDRYIDIIVIGLIFSFFVLFGVDDKIIFESAIFYISLAFFSLLVALVSYILNKQVKNFIMKIANLFNERIKFKIQKVFWAFITIFKDMLFNLNKLKLMVLTLVMWGAYFSSYFFVSLALTNFGNEIELLDLLLIFFSKNNLELSSMSSIIKLTGIYSICAFIYLLIPLIILLCYSFKRKHENNEKIKRLELLPQLNAQEKMSFLDIYFTGKNREYINNYLKINRDIVVVNDCSAGSNAKTILCINEDEIFYRKFAFDEESIKLKEQVEWLNKYSKTLPVTDIKRVEKLDKSLYYDMPYKDTSINYFNYIHSHATDENWKILKRILNDLDNKIHKYNQKVAKESIKEYLDEKLINNLRSLNNYKIFRELSKYDFLVINGKKYKNLKMFEKYFSFEYIYEIFKNDYVSDVHGDLTIENIIYSKENKGNYYLIDPNPNNVLSSPYLDYSKLLQSLHGGYEFLLGIKNVEVSGNVINYLFIKSNAYYELYNKYVKFLKEKFSDEAIRIIYFHEIFHWVRILRYKVTDYTKFILSYSRLIIILNDIIDMYGVDNDEK